MLGHSTIVTFSALGGILLLAGCAGTDTIPAQQPLYDRLGANRRFRRSSTSLWRMWQAIAASTAGSPPQIFPNSKRIWSIKSVWQLEGPASTRAAT
jgi:hypothetical protein